MRCALLGVMVALAGCMPGASAAGSPTTSVTIFAAASLGDAMERVTTAYEAARPGTALTVSTDSSAALEAQIEQGAAADVFLAADTANPRKLVEAGLAAGEPVVFAANALAIITPADNPAGLTGPFDLARPGVRVVAAGDHVPISRYASTLVDKLAAAPGAPTGFAAQYRANVVSREDNVAAVRAKIELGEGDAAIVYATDATSNRVTVIDIPDGGNVRAEYAGVVVNTATDPGAARAFLDWLAGPAGQEILGAFGFLPPAS